MKSLFKVGGSENQVESNLLFCFIAILIGATSCLLLPYQAIAQKLLWCILALAGFFYIVCNRRRVIGAHSGKSSCFSFLNISFLFLLPYIGASVASFVFCAVRGDTLGTVQQAFTTTCFIVVDVFVSVFLICHYKARALSLIIISFIISYCVTIGYAVICNGPEAFIARILRCDFAFLESHDVGVAVVPPLILIICCMIEQRQILKKDLISAVLLVFILILCGKRSAYLSLLSAAFGWILLRVSYSLFHNHKRWVICFVGVVGVSLCLFYVIAIHHDWLGFLSQGFGTLSDRYNVWKHFDNIYSLSIDYYGYGFGYVHRYMVSGLGTWMVNAYGYLHNSILQIYIEVGLLLFIAWFFFLFIVIPMSVFRRYGPFRACFVMTLIISMVAMWTVDNTLTYPLYLVSFFVSIGVYLGFSPAVVDG